MFVSNFTDLDHDKLRKLYKKTASKRREEDKEVGWHWQACLCAREFSYEKMVCWDISFVKMSVFVMSLLLSCGNCCTLFILMMYVYVLHFNLLPVLVGLG